MSAPNCVQTFKDSILGNIFPLIVSVIVAIAAQVRQKVHIILDGAGYHRSALVKDWAYVMNEEVRNNHYFASAKQFREEIRRFFSKILLGLAGALSCRINNNFQMLENASSS